MQNNKSYAEFVLGTYASLLKDCEVRYPALTKEFKRDYTRLSSAIEHHGIRFALDVMPAWRKHFDKCLASGRLTRSGLPHFSCWKTEGTVPRLFRGLVLRVFDIKGDLKPEPDVQAIKLIRQLLGVFRKLRMDCGPKSRSDAVKDFIMTDLEVAVGNLNWDADEDFDAESAEKLSFIDSSMDGQASKSCSIQDFKVSDLPYELARSIQQVADYFTASLGEYDPAESRFRHGPGAVSDQRFGSNKYDFKSWPKRLEEVFPAADFACANFASWEESSLYKLSDKQLQRELPASLAAVPKTIKAPRLVACEPTSLQWCQQSICEFLYRRVSRSTIGAFVDFQRQELNGDLALAASHDGAHCTIDLSSASDRVSCWHVERLFRRSPSLLRSLWATRSREIKQSICRYSPKLYKLRKYSTMGNATTFPVQSLFFLTVAIGTLLYVRRQRVSDRVIKELGGNTVRVYGDDIIVPKDCADLTVSTLHALGLRVNVDKTFLTGKFRESCGVDAFGGHDVTASSVMDVPIRTKPGSIVSSIDVHNNLSTKGYYATCAFVRKIVEELGFTKILISTHGSGSFGWSRTYDMDEPRYKLRSSPDRHCPQARVLRQKVKEVWIPAEGTAALLQYFTEATEVVTQSLSGLGYQWERARVTLRLGWVDLE